MKISEYINILSEKIFETEPPFEISGEFVSQKCREASEKFVKGLKAFELWALNSK